MMARAGAGPEGTLQLKIGGMSCSFCANSIERALAREAGVTKVHVSLAHEEALVRFRPAETVGAVLAGLNAMRWFGPDDARRRAGDLYPRFFETIFVRAAMLRASPLSLVAEAYRAAEPAAHFAHPDLPDPVAIGIAPVFAAEVAWTAGRWSVSDPRFRTGPALFLANMLAVRRDGRDDLFLADDRLAALHGREPR